MPRLAAFLLALAAVSAAPLLAARADPPTDSAADSSAKDAPKTRAEAIAQATGKTAGQDASPVDPVLEEATGLAGYVMFRESGAPGLVLGVLHNGEGTVLGYGETAPDSKKTPDGRSLFRLNSITKAFAGEVLGSLAADGTLRLTATLEHYAGGVHVPTYTGRPITLLDLATYSAAMPREMGDIPKDAWARGWPTRADRWKWLPTYELPWTPGTIASYSNIGFDFLTDAMATAAGKPYATLLADRVTHRLGMTDTTLTPDADQCARLMTGTGLGGNGPCADATATEGSGGLYSTGNDMLVWLRHNLEDDTPALALSHAIYRPRQAMPAAIGFDEAGQMGGLGLGWVMVPASGATPMLLAKSGGGVGFMSYIAFAPGRDVGAFVIVNRADFGMFAGLIHGVNGMIASLATR